MGRVLRWCKGQPVLIVAFIAALVSMLFIPPDEQYLGYCNRAVLIQLFCLMIAVAGFRGIGVFEALTRVLLKKAGGIRRLGLLLMTVCFFSSMLVTNDVALLTFVPLTLLLFSKINDAKSLIWIIVIETAAANLGSMLTPIGNPQNLYIYAQYGLDPIRFISLMLPLGIISYLLLFLLCFIVLKGKCRVTPSEKHPIPKIKLSVFAVMFILCILTVLRIIPDLVCLAVVAALTLIFDRRLFLRADYALLATFVCFFVFVGNIARIELIRDFFAAVMQGRELITSALLSQCISNVPAAVMLSGFTDNANALLLGVNIGGMSTPIASLASLISYQFYSKSENSDAKRYLLIFSLVNFGMLILLLLFALFIQPLIYI